MKALLLEKLPNIKRMKGSDELQRQVTRYTSDGGFDILSYLAPSRRIFLIILSIDVVVMETTATWI